MPRIFDNIDLELLPALRQARFARLDGVEVPQQKVFIFGFSRGAYAARLFAGLIAFSGVPRFGVSEGDGLDAFFDQKLRKAKRLKERKTYFDIDIEFLGVWDTVNSTGEGDLGERTLPDNVRHAYHAMSIDERRNNFGLVRWVEGSRGEEIWFPGVHSDVGGGYKARELSDISLGWMLAKASAHGLMFTSEAAQYTENLPVGSIPTIHDSFTGKWIILGSKSRTSRAGDIFHRSVQTAMAQASNYHPTFSVTSTENGQTYLV